MRVLPVVGVLAALHVLALAVVAWIVRGYYGCPRKRRAPLPRAEVRR